MELDNNFSIEKEKIGVSLVETYIGASKDGVEITKEKKRYYGSVYIALQCYLSLVQERHLEGTLDDNIKAVEKSVKQLEDMREQIKAEFRTEVKVVQ